MALGKLGQAGAIMAATLLAVAPAIADPDGLSDARNAIHLGDYARALAILQPLAQQGNAAAALQLGSLYFNGLGTSVDGNAALKWFMPSAKNGDAEAEKDVAVVYQSGKVGANDGEAVRWFKLSAEQGNAEAESNLGFMYRMGRGTQRDVKEGIRWTVIAAERGHPISLGNIGTSYAEGQGVPQSYSKALFWMDVSVLRLAANSPDRSKHQNYANSLASHLNPAEAERIATSAAAWVPAQGALDSVLTDAGLPPNGPAAPKLRPTTAAVPIPSVATAPAGRPAAPPAGPTGNSTGSGFILNSAGEVLTNNHVVDRCGSIRTRLANGEPVAATLVVADKLGDLAVLRPTARLGEPLALREKAARQGETVIVAGFPLSGLLTTDMNISEGIVSALSGLISSSRQIQISAPIQSGNSGGPVMDEDGAVLGVVQSALNSATLAAAGAISQNANFAIKASSVREFLDARAIPYETTSNGRAHGRVPERARLSTVFIECMR